MKKTSKIKHLLMASTIVLGTIGALSMTACDANDEVISGAGLHEFCVDQTDYDMEFYVKFDKEGETGVYLNTNFQKKKGIYFYFHYEEENCFIGIKDYPTTTYSIEKVNPWDEEGYIGYKKLTLQLKEWYKVKIYRNAQYMKFWFNELSTDIDPFPKFDLNIAESYTATEFSFDCGNDAETEFKNLKISESTPINTENTYTNYLIQALSDPFVLEDDNGVYYLYGNNVGDDSCFYGFRSTDLVNWEKSSTPVLDYSMVRGNHFRSPRAIKVGDIYYLLFNYKVSSEDYVQGYASSTSPLGPFTQDGDFTFPNSSIYIGARPIVDPKTSKYYVVVTCCSQGNSVSLFEINIDNETRTMAVIPDQIVADSKKNIICVAEEDWEVNGGGVAEGGYIFYHNGYYYLMYTGGVYNTAYGEGYAVSKDITGPYVKYENNPVLFATRCAWGNGDAAIAFSPNKEKAYFVYFRHTSNTTVRPLNTCTDEIRFVENPNGGADIIVCNGPTVSPQPIPDLH